MVIITILLQANNGSWTLLQTKGGTKFPSSSPKAIKLTNNIVKMIFKDYQPLSIVEDDGFKSLMAEAEPRLCLPTRKSLRYTIIPAFYKKNCKSCNRENTFAQTEVWPSCALFRDNRWLDQQQNHELPRIFIAYC